MFEHQRLHLINNGSIMAAMVGGSCSNGVFFQIWPYWPLLPLTIQLLVSAFRLHGRLKQQREQGDWGDRFHSVEADNFPTRSLPSKCIRLVRNYVLHLIHAHFVMLLLVDAVPDWGHTYNAAAFRTLLLEHTLIWMLHMAHTWQRAKRRGGAEEEVMGIAVDYLVMQQAFSSKARPLALVCGAQMLVLEWGRRFALNNVMHPEAINALHRVKGVQSGKARSVQLSLLAEPEDSSEGQRQSYGGTTLELVRSLELQWLVSDIGRAASSCLCLLLFAYGGLVYLLTAVATALLTESISEWSWNLFLASSFSILVLSGILCYRSMRSNLWTDEDLRTVFAHQASEQVVPGRLPEPSRPPLWNTTCLLLSAMGAPTVYTATSNLLGDQSTVGVPAVRAEAESEKAQGKQEPEWFEEKCPKAKQRIIKDSSRKHWPSFAACEDSRTWYWGSLTSFTSTGGFSFNMVKLDWWYEGKEEVIIERWALEQPLKWMVRKWSPFMVPFVETCVADFEKALASLDSNKTSKLVDLLSKLRTILSTKVVRKVSDCQALQKEVAHSLAKWVGFKTMWLQFYSVEDRSARYLTLEQVKGTEKDTCKLVVIQDHVSKLLQIELGTLAQHFGSSELHAVERWQQDWVDFKAESRDLSAFVTLCAALCLCWPMCAWQYEQPPFEQLEVLGPRVVAGASGCLLLSRLQDSLTKTLGGSAITGVESLRGEQTGSGPQNDIQ